MTGDEWRRVKDAVADKYVDKVHVKVIGSENDKFSAGETDLRGLYIADALHGTSTVIARLTGDRYAFFRGKTHLGAVAPAAPAPQLLGIPASGTINLNDNNELLRNNLNIQNGTFQNLNRGNYQNFFNNSGNGVKAQKAY